MSKLYLHNNFSEKSATLKCHGSALDWPLQVLFADNRIKRATVGPSPGKRRKVSDLGMASPVLPKQEGFVQQELGKVCAAKEEPEDDTAGQALAELEQVVKSELNVEPPPPAIGEEGK